MYRPPPAISASLCCDDILLLLKVLLLMVTIVPVLIITAPYPLFSEALNLCNTVYPVPFLIMTPLLIFTTFFREVMVVSIPQCLTPTLLSDRFLQLTNSRPHCVPLQWCGSQSSWRCCLSTPAIVMLWREVKVIAVFSSRSERSRNVVSL